MRSVVAAFLLLSAGCATSSATSSPGGEEVVEPGLNVEDMQVGTGEEAATGRTVEIAYTGRLADGRRFGSSEKDGRPLAFTVGRGQVIRGLDEGIVGMKVGGKRRLIVPPKYARGLSSSIPKDATLVFEIELLQVR